MKKIKIILPILIVFFLFIFLLKARPLEKDLINITDDYLFEDPENYLIGKVGESTLIQNQNLGFSFNAPKEWSVKGVKEDFVSGITLLSDNYTEDENFFIKDGCKIIVTVYKEENEYSYLKEEVELSEESTSLVEVGNHFGKIEVESPYFKNIKVPLHSNIYSFEGYFSEKEKDYCRETYDSLINAISFEK